MCTERVTNEVVFSPYLSREDLLLPSYCNPSTTRADKASPALRNRYQMGRLRLRGRLRGSGKLGQMRKTELELTAEPHTIREPSQALVRPLPPRRLKVGQDNMLDK